VCTTWLYRDPIVVFAGTLFFMYISILMNSLWLTLVNVVLTLFIWKKTIPRTYLPASMRTSQGFYQSMEAPYLSYIQSLHVLYCLEYSLFCFKNSGSLAMLMAGCHYPYPLHAFVTFHTTLVNAFLKCVGLLTA
jgi:hypothetical protein